ncbi:MAG TPA: dihydropteroate synthase [Ktedonobacteraceae bacterium]|nr:dihydropteroate synthase [Ktedonobacteraceae bacterium]
MLQTFPPVTWSRWRLDWGQRTHVMGIINVTPDSFAGDGVLSADLEQGDVPAHALEQARAFVAEGASLVDVGGESTRPGSTPLPLEEELRRVIPVIQHLAANLPPEVIISIDTYKAEVARRALDAGAALVNDIWGLQRDPEMAALVAERGVPVVLMANMRGNERHEIVSDVVRFLARSIDLALAAGVAWERIIIDPGIGFSSLAEDHLTLVSRLGELRVLGRPILLGTSRKRTIGLVLGNLPPEERVEGTAATVALGIAQGADIVRVHDVREMMRVVKMSDALVRNNFQRPAIH